MLILFGYMDYLIYYAWLGYRIFFDFLHLINPDLSRWANSSWGRKLIVQKKRAALTDFERFKVMVARIKVKFRPTWLLGLFCLYSQFIFLRNCDTFSLQRSSLVKKELAKLRKEKAWHFFVLGTFSHDDCRTTICL